MGVEKEMGMRRWKEQSVFVKAGERGEENWGEEEAKLQGLAASFLQTDSRLELLPRRTVCILLHKSPYAYAPLDMIACVCEREFGGPLPKPVT